MRILHFSGDGLGEELGRRDGLLFGSCLWNLTAEQRIWGKEGQNLWPSLSQFFPVRAGSGIGDEVLMFHIVCPYLRKEAA